MPEGLKEKTNEHKHWGVTRGGDTPGISHLSALMEWGVSTVKTMQD